MVHLLLASACQSDKLQLAEASTTSLPAEDGVRLELMERNMLAEVDAHPLVRPV